MLSDAKAPTVLPSLDVVRDPRHVFPIRLFHRIERQKVAVRILLAVLGSEWAVGSVEKASLYAALFSSDRAVYLGPCALRPNSTH